MTSKEMEWIIIEEEQKSKKYKWSRYENAINSKKKIMRKSASKPFKAFEQSLTKIK